MYKCKFTLSDDTEEFEGYTDGSTWNKWDNVAMTREQVKKFLDASQADYRFLEANMGWNDRPYPILVLYNWGGVEPVDVESFAIFVDDEFVETYYLDLEFMVVK